jgi:hypothetical protein
MTDNRLDELITLNQAAEEYPLVYSTLAKAAADGRIRGAIRTGGTPRKAGMWFVTRRDIDYAIKVGLLRPRQPKE